MKIHGVAEGVVNHLRGLIISGALPPGQRLSEEELAAKLNVSRSPVREATRALANEQLVAIVPRKGAFVTELSASLLEKAFDAREMVECSTVDILAHNKQTHLPEVETAIAKVKKMGKIDLDDRENLLRYLHAMANFHIKLVEATENQWMISLAESVQIYIARYQYLYLASQKRRSFSAHVHEELSEMIAEGKYSETKERIKELVQYAKSSLSKIITEKA